MSEWHVVVIHPDGGQTCYCFDTKADADTAHLAIRDVISLCDMRAGTEVLEPVEWKDSDTTNMKTVYAKE